jgi:hypothetical protein
MPCHSIAQHSIGHQKTHEGNADNAMQEKETRRPIARCKVCGRERERERMHGTRQWKKVMMKCVFTNIEKEKGQKKQKRNKKGFSRKY